MRLSSLFFLLVLVGTMLISGCKTTNNTGYSYNKSNDAYSSDGPAYHDPGRLQRVKNAFSTFQM